MLTKELGIADYDRGRILPDRLTTKRHSQYIGYAERMLDVYRNGIGWTRRDLHRSVQAVFDDEPDCPQRRIDAFCKLLDDTSEYQRDRRRRAAELRRRVFQMAAEKHPLVRQADRLFETTESQVKIEIAKRLGRPWAEIDADLFADVIEFHRLLRFDGYPDGRSLLARYNVAQAQVVLFRAVSMTVRAGDEFKVILRAARLAGLMHSIARTGAGNSGSGKSGVGKYRIRFDGPASLLRQTRRYGVRMARFLPALIACRHWSLHAVIQARSGNRTSRFDLSSADGLRSHLPPPETFDSEVEARFAEKWGPKPREGWRLIREGEILYDRQKVFVPDFAFHHEDGRTALMEIVGFWTPEYLEAKMKTLRLFRNTPILLAVAHSLTQDVPELARNAIVYKSVIRIGDVLERLNQ